MHKPRTCPHCKAQIPPEKAIFDENLNFLCNFCNKVIFPITELNFKKPESRNSNDEIDY